MPQTPKQYWENTTKKLEVIKEGLEERNQGLQDELNYSNYLRSLESEVRNQVITNLDAERQRIIELENQLNQVQQDLQTEKNACQRVETSLESALQDVERLKIENKSLTQLIEKEREIFYRVAEIAWERGNDFIERRRLLRESRSYLSASVSALVEVPVKLRSWLPSWSRNK